MPHSSAGWAVLAATIALSFLHSCVASRCFVNFSRDKYPSCAQLSPNVSLHWAVQNGTITWAADVDGVWDWVGLGISEGGMLGADLAVAAHNVAARQWTAADYWSTDFSFPQLDTQQDVALVYMSRQVHDNANGNTLVAMRRPLVSCDPAGQDVAVLNDTRQTVVYAYGKGSFGYHGTSNRGEAEVIFLPNATAASAGGQTPPLQTLELRMPAFSVPTAPTTYQCVNLALPSDSKYHVYSYEPLIDDSPLVHHFVAYACRGDAPPSTALGQPYDCLQYMECEDFYMGWAPGVDKVDAPAAAALAFGAGTRIKYLALQIHYTNLQGVAGQIDSSGFRLHYSSTLKQYDMGVLTLGSYNISVPPGAASWSTLPDVCPGACTAQLAAGAGAGSAAGTGPVPGGGLILVESFYHMHQLGKSMVTRHVRNGVELAPLGSRDYFGFDYQSPVGIPPGTRQLLPGDLLITTCTYTGVGRTNVTKFGLASYQEMCFNFLTYYPYNDNITDCTGLPWLPGLATCTNNDVLNQIAATDDGAAAAQEAVKAGVIVPVPANLTFSPFQPTCVRSAPLAAPSGGGGDSSGAVSDGVVDVDSPSWEQQQQEHRRKERNVGGAVAAILIVTTLGGVAIFLVVRAMKRRRQLEEEQHLFEKYNPNSSSIGLAAGGGDYGGEDVYGKGLYSNGGGGGGGDELTAVKGGGATGV